MREDGVMRALLLVVLSTSLSLGLFGCSKSDDGKKDDDELIEKIDGKAKIDGKKVKIESCKAVKGEQNHEALELVVGGLTILRDELLGMTIDDKRVECSRQSSTSRGGTFGEKRWTKGKLELTCETKKGELDLDVTYDCGSKSRPSNLKD